MKPNYVLSQTAIVCRIFTFIDFLMISKFNLFFMFQILCANGYVSTLKLLIEEGNADIHERSPATFWVPLHEVALRGHLDCVKLLLSHNAAIHPRTVDGDTPKDLALRSGKDSVVEYFGECLKTIPAAAAQYVGGNYYIFPPRTFQKVELKRPS